MFRSPARSAARTPAPPPLVDDAQPVAAAAFARRQHFGGGEKLAEPVHPHRTRPAEGGVEDVVVADQCPGVGMRGLRALPMTTRLQDDHGL